MKAYKLTNIVFDNITDFEDLPKINESNCDDFLSQLIFYKIDQYAYTICGSLHNIIYDKREILPFLILCLDDEINPKDSDPNTAEDFENELKNIENSFNNTMKLFTPPNEGFKQVRAKKTPIKKVNINGTITEVFFNPYLIALYFSDIYFTLYNDKRILDWCEQGHIKFESIEKVSQIIKDKYLYPADDLTRISFKILSNIVHSSEKERITKLEELLGFKGTDLMKHYATWSNNFYNELIGVIKGLFGKLAYS